MIVCAIVLCVPVWLGAGEFQVNVRTSGAQANAAVAADAEGRAIVVWSSYYSSSGRSNEIIARRFDPNGVPLDADEFQVNTVREGNQTSPAVAANADGAFLIAWHGPGLDAEDVFARLFDPNGVPLTDEFLVNINTEGQQIHPRVAVGADTFVTVWESRQASSLGGIIAIRGQLFDGSAAPLGSEIHVDEAIYDARYPSVAMDAEGRFVVAWLQDRTTKAVMARCFDANGVALGKPFQVNSIGFGSLTRPAVAMTDSGDFVVAWDGDPKRAADDDVHARCFDPNGTPRTDQFTVNSLCEGSQQWPAVAIDETGDFVVVWQHDHGDPNLATDVWARRFHATGLPAGEQFQLNGYVAGRQQSADVAIAGDSLIAVWQSDGQDGSGYGIFARIEPWTTAADPDDNELPRIVIPPLD
jgi:hypothetical protein